MEPVSRRGRRHLSHRIAGFAVLALPASTMPILSPNPQSQAFPRDETPDGKHVFDQLQKPSVTRTLAAVIPYNKLGGECSAPSCRSKHDPLRRRSRTMGLVSESQVNSGETASRLDLLSRIHGGPSFHLLTPLWVIPDGR